MPSVWFWFSLVVPLATAQVLQTYVGNQALVWTVSFNPRNASELVTSSADKAARLWNSKSGALLQEYLAHTDEVTCARFNPANSSEIATSGKDGRIILWHKESGTMIREFVGGHVGAVFMVAFNPANQSELVTSSADMTLVLWNKFNGQILRQFSDPQGHAANIRALAHHPTNSSLFVAGSDDGKLLLWEKETGKISKSFVGHPALIDGVEFNVVNPNEIVSAGCTDNTARLWSIHPDLPQPLLVIDNLGNGVNCASVNPFNLTEIVTGDNVGQVKVWHRDTGTLLRSTAAGTTAIATLAIDPTNGSRVATGSDDGSSFLVDPGTTATVLLPTLTPSVLPVPSVRTAVPSPPATRTPPQVPNILMPHTRTQLPTRATHAPAPNPPESKLPIGAIVGIAAGGTAFVAATIAAWKLLVSTAGNAAEEAMDAAEDTTNTGTSIPPVDETEVQLELTDESQRGLSDT